MKILVFDNTSNLRGKLILDRQLLHLCPLESENDKWGNGKTIKTPTSYQTDFESNCLL